MSKKKVINTSGKRKTAIARATLTPGSGIVRVNKILLEDVTPTIVKHRLMEPLMLLDKSFTSKINLNINVKGGGLTSQADAVRIAMCRALSEFGGGTIREELVSYDRRLLVTDTRVKEKTKPNCQGQARSKRQKSYR